MAITGTGDNPVVVTGTTAAKDDIKSSKTWYITQLYWLQATTAGHKCAVQDGDGRELFEFYATSDNTSQSFTFDPPLLARNGIYSDDMDSGTLYVFLK